MNAPLDFNKLSCCSSVLGVSHSQCGDVSIGIFKQWPHSTSVHFLVVILGCDLIKRKNKKALLHDVPASSINLFPLMSTQAATAGHSERSWFSRFCTFAELLGHASEDNQMDLPEGDWKNEWLNAFFFLSEVFSKSIFCRIILDTFASFLIFLIFSFFSFFWYLDVCLGHPLKWQSD